MPQPILAPLQRKKYSPLSESLSGLSAPRGYLLIVSEGLSISNTRNARDTTAKRTFFSLSSTDCSLYAQQTFPRLDEVTERNKTSITTTKYRLRYCETSIKISANDVLQQQQYALIERRHLRFNAACKLSFISLLPYSCPCSSTDNIYCLQKFSAEYN